MRDVLRLVERRQALLAVVLGTATVLCGAALLAASGALITGATLDPSSLLVLMPLITSVRLFGVARASIRYAERVVSHDLALRLVGRLREELLDRLVPLSPAALTGVRGGELLARIRGDVDELQNVVVRLLAPAAVALLASTVAVALVALVSVPLALVLAALLLALGVAVPVWARGAGRASSVGAARADAAFGADALDLVRGLADHAGGDGGATALRALSASLARQEAAERAGARLAATTTFLREGVPALGLVAALWLVGWQVSAGGSRPELLAATALGVLGAFEAVGGLGAVWAGAEGIRAAAGRVRALGAERPVVADPEHPRPRPASAALRFEGVGLSYPGSTRPVLRDLDLLVGDGEKVALVGRSGAGKSSVLALAMRWRDPTAGRVTLGGADLRELRLDDVRAATAWAPQAPQVLGGTLAGNLGLAVDDAAGAVDDAALEAVLRDVGLGHLLGEVGLHGWVGESGERLSAGERARVGLARALLSPAPLLLVDEPTAHLDAALAARLVGLLAGSPRGVLLVTHDPGVLDDRWRVVALEAPRTGPLPGPAPAADTALEPA